MRKGVLTNQEAIAQEMRVTQKTDNSLSKNLLQHARGFQESLKRHFPANQTDYGLCKQININFIYSFSLYLSIYPLRKNQQIHGTLQDLVCIRLRSLEKRQRRGH